MIRSFTATTLLLLSLSAASYDCSEVKRAADAGYAQGVATQEAPIRDPNTNPYSPPKPVEQTTCLTQVGDYINQIGALLASFPYASAFNSKLDAYVRNSMTTVCPANAQSVINETSRIYGPIPRVPSFPQIPTIPSVR